MNSKFINVLVFAAGAAIGSAVTWKFVKTRYERIAQEEIDSVKKTFTEMMSIRPDQNDNEICDEYEAYQGRSTQIDWSDLEDLDEDENEDAEFYEEDANDAAERDLREYGRLINQYTSIDMKGGVKTVTKEPYVIAPYDYGEIDGYRKFELTYYKDDVLEDEEYNIIEDSEELLGRDSLTTFGEYEDDAVFVRNEKLRADFQILRDPRTYAEAKSVKPHQVDDE